MKRPLCVTLQWEAITDICWGSVWVGGCIYVCMCVCTYVCVHSGEMGGTVVKVDNIQLRSKLLKTAVELCYTKLHSKHAMLMFGCQFANQAALQNLSEDLYTKHHE